MTVVTAASLVLAGLTLVYGGASTLLAKGDRVIGFTSLSAGVVCLGLLLLVVI